MLPKEGWLHLAQALHEGERKRVPHDCGPGDTLIIEHKQGGWSSYCHRCADKGWVPKALPTLAERAAARAAQLAAQEQIRHDPRPPMPANFDVPSWPLEARVWLYKAGLFTEDIGTLGAYYHEPTKRVVLPVVDGGKVVYWQARNVGLCGPGSPKYLNPRVDREQLLACFGSDSVVVLTEDILSAFRVGQVSQGWSLLGTKLPTPALARLIKEGKPVIVWMDNDPTPKNPGQHAARIIMRSLTNAGVDCVNLVTEKDAKALSRAQIREVIDDCLRRHTAGRPALPLREAGAREDGDHCLVQGQAEVRGLADCSA